MELMDRHLCSQKEIMLSNLIINFECQTVPRSSISLTKLAEELVIWFAQFGEAGWWRIIYKKKRCELYSHALLCANLCFI